MRAGTIHAPAFDNVVYVGHSYGSNLGNYHAAKHPQDVDNYILTGWSALPPVLKGNPGVLTFAPAALVSKAFTGLAVGYLATTTEASVEAPLYAGGYDPTLPRVDWAVEDITTLSQLISVNGFQNATGFTGGIYIVTGEQDAITCGGDCLKGEWVAEGLDYFPNAQQKDYLLVPQTGHDTNLHYSAPYSWWMVNQWLTKRL